MKIKLNKPFAPDSGVDEYDVKQIKKALNRLGYYAPLETIGITGIPDRAMFEALKKFQQDHGLSATGTAKPGDATIEPLNREAAKTPQGDYIWRTVEDDKVRSSHAQYNRTRRAWADSPDPGEQFNCRCWAEMASLDSMNCNEQKAAYDNAAKEFQRLDKKKNDVETELRSLLIEHKKIVKEVSGIFGTNMLASMPPAKSVKEVVITQVLQNSVQSASEKRLHESTKRNLEISNKIKYLEGELKLTIFQRKEAEENFLEAHKNLKECAEQNRH